MPATGARAGQHQRFAHHQRRHGAGLRAERDPQPDLARPARDHVRHQAAERAAGEQERHGAEERGDDRDETLLHERLVDAAPDRFNADRRARIQAPDCRPQRFAD